MIVINQAYRISHPGSFRFRSIRCETRCNFRTSMMRFPAASHRISFILCAIALAPAGEAREPYHPAIDPANFTHVVSNPYFPLVPGTTMTFLEQDGREKRENKVTVLRETKIVMAVKCLVVHDTVTLDGALLEETFEYYAQDKVGAVWLFAESTKEFKSFGRVDTTGSWEAGVNAAQPGIIMPARPKIGDRYRQQYLANVAEDIGQITALNESVTVPAGAYGGCIKTREWSMLESVTSKKWYAKGVGLVRSESTDGEVSTLISVTRK
jgi:hypothetical protein